MNYPPELVDAIRALAAEGLTQSRIAHHLGIPQPYVCVIMRANQIVRGDGKYNGRMRIAVQVFSGNKVVRAIPNATPEQLEQLTALVRDPLNFQN